MKKSIVYTREQLGELSNLFGKFCEMSPNFVTRFFKEVVRGLKTNSELSEDLIVYLENHYKTLETARIQRGFGHKELEQLRNRLLNVINIAYLGVLVL